MNSYLQILGFVIIGVGLLYFGYSLFFGFGIKGHAPGGKKKKKKDDLEGEAGMPRTCPVCSIRLIQG